LEIKKKNKIIFLLDKNADDSEVIIGRWEVVGKKRDVDREMGVDRL
jgi:hypothetical protein